LAEPRGGEEQENSFGFLLSAFFLRFGI